MPANKSIKVNDGFFGVPNGTSSFALKSSVSGNVETSSPFCSRILRYFSPAIES
ncbi:hypothetical protein [Treponema succinifaciens]|uniref:hypothetical protein n=1 Tax=Treponema succinifaciens TaxID=167 RepID=UPI0023F71025|nr:hypothetical protein [Treponema succinifaciens]